MFEAQSFPIVCNYDDNGLDVPDGLQADVEQIISKNHFRSSSSENEADEELDSPNEMTILRPKPSRRKVRIASDKSYGELTLMVAYKHVVSVVICTTNNVSLCFDRIFILSNIYFTSHDLIIQWPTV